MKASILLALLFSLFSLYGLEHTTEPTQKNTFLDLKKTSRSTHMAHTFAQALAAHILQDKATKILESIPPLSFLPNNTQDAIKTFFTTPQPLPQDLQEKIPFLFVFHILCSKETAEQKITYLTLTEPYLSQTEKPFVSFLINNLLPIQNITALTDTLHEEILFKQDLQEKYLGQKATLLHCAAALNHNEALEGLIPFYEDLDVQDAAQSTALHYAAHNNCPEAVQTLIKYGATPSLQTNENVTPLDLALISNSFACAQALIEKESNLVDRIITLLTRNNNPAAAQFLAAQLTSSGLGAKLPSSIQLFLAIAAHDAQFSKYYNPCNWKKHPLAQKLHRSTPLHIAVSFKNEEAARFFIEQGIDLDAPTSLGHTALHIAIKNGSIPLTLLLLEKKAYKEIRGPGHYTPLHMAIMVRDEELVHLLLTYGADRNAQNLFGNTALHLAILNFHKPIISSLLEKDIHLEDANVHGETALHFAVANGYEHLTRDLLDLGANIESANNLHATSVHLAAQYGHEQILQLLLERGARINTIDNEGVTPLLKAINYGHPQCAKLLAQAGAPLTGLGLPTKLILPCIPLNQNQKSALKEIFAYLPTESLLELLQQFIILGSSEAHDYHELISLLLDYAPTLTNTLIQTAEGEDYSLLELAILISRVEVIKLFLDHGASACIKSKKGVSPLFFAVSLPPSLEQIAICKLLLEAGALVDEEINTFTPLDLAIMCKNKQLIIFLSHKGQSSSCPIYKIINAYFEDNVKTIFLALYEMTGTVSFKVDMLGRLLKFTRLFEADTPSDFSQRMYSLLKLFLKKFKEEQELNDTKAAAAGPFFKG